MTNHQQHVLLIEDNPGDADLVRLRLVESRPDVEVCCVDRLSAGLDTLSKEPPSVVLLDLNLPDSRGAETFRKLLSKAPGVPVVVLSGQDDEDLATKAVHQGVQDYLVKGNFDSKQLARAMRYAIERQALLTSIDMSRKQQLQFKDAFLSHVSHELRTPLTCIHQFITILLDGLAGTLAAEQREHLETVFRSVKQLRSMISDLLEATRAESGKITVEVRCIAIGDVIQQAVAMMQNSAQQKQVGLEAGLDTRIPLVHADPHRLLQVLTNLLDNAIKFTPPDGSVMVKACLVESDPDFVYVSVADTGRGISPEARNLIFERLYQDPNSIDDSRKGLGLGLYISKELVHLHGGRIWVESQPGHGSVFTFTVPLFSLAKLLFPVVTDQGRLRDAVSLITIAFAPSTKLMASAEGAWQTCLQLIRACTLPGRDLVLPDFANPKQAEAFLVVVSTDEKGARAVEKRIREALERSNDLKNYPFQISSTGLQLPSSQSQDSVASLVQQLAGRISETALGTLESMGSLQAKLESSAAPIVRTENQKERKQ